MNEYFGPEACAALGDTERRAAAAIEAAELGQPSTEAEEWRYSPIDELGLDRFAPVTKPPSDMGGPATEDCAVVTVDGFVTQVRLSDAALAAGLTVGPTGDPGRLEAPGIRTGFDALSEAFGPDPVVVTVPDGVALAEPITVTHHLHTAMAATFPRVVVVLGENAEATVIERFVGGEDPTWCLPRVELRVGKSARLRFGTSQDLDRDGAIVMGRLLAEVGADADLRVGIASFGARYGRLRTDVRLAGRGASGRMSAASFATGSQVHDFRTFQHHDAPNTFSDLLFKGVQTDKSGAIYTGLIHIHPDGAGSNAYQTNRNLKLSDDAWAWSVPNLEIENNDVRCSHASTVSPLDEDQSFYLAARGVPPQAAQRLIVAGFFDDVVGRLPAAVAADAAAAIDANLEELDV